MLTGRAVCALVCRGLARRQLQRSGQGAIVVWTQMGWKSREGAGFRLSEHSLEPVNGLPMDVRNEGEGIIWKESESLGLSNQEDDDERRKAGGRAAWLFINSRDDSP